MARQSEFLAGGGEMGERLRALDWTGHPLGPPRAWPQPLRTAVGIMLNSRHPMFLAWGPELSFLYNDGYIPILGAKHPAALARPFAAIWEEIWSDIWPLIERALGGEATWSEDLHLVMHRNGYPEDTWYTFSYSPILDEDGQVGGMFCACTETTAKVLLERRLKFLVGLGDALRAASSPAAVKALAAEALGRHLRAGRAGYAEVDDEQTRLWIEGGWTDGSLEDVSGREVALEDLRPDLAAAFSAGKTLCIDDVEAAQVRPKQMAFAAAPAAMVVPLVKGGRLMALLFAGHASPRRWTDDERHLAEEVAERTWDAVERARSEVALRESEARFRAMADCAPAPVWVTSAAGGVAFVNDAFCELVGKPREALLGDVWVELMHPDDIPRVLAHRVQARRDNSPYTFEARFKRADGEWRAMRASAQPRFDGAGDFQGYVGLAIDVTDIRDAERRQQLLINELNHRVKNTLATVQSLCRQTLREGTDALAARDILTSRFLALSSAHDVLTRRNWESADLGEVAAGAVAAYAGDEGRFSMAGPPARVGPRAALALSMALHELATNAAKYGALSTDGGRVDVAWRLGGDGRTVELEWRESGGPKVTAPARRGFGARLLEQGLAAELRGAAELDFAEGGVVCFVRAPLAEPG